MKPDDLAFTIESIAAVFDELPGLVNPHWEEVAKDKQVMKLNIDKDYYVKGNANGSILFVAARDNGRLAGYCVFWLHSHPHYKDVLCAQSDVYYLLPEYRSGLNGFNLLKNGLQFAKGLGATYAFVGTKIGHDHPEIMEHLGLKPRDLIYGGPL